MMEILTLPSTAQNECKTPAIPDHIAMPLFREALEFIEANADFICEVYAQDWESRRVHYRATAKAGMTHGAGALRVSREHFEKYASCDVIQAGSQIYAIREISQVNEMVTLLETACFIVVAGFVGMRISEIGSLKSGCLSVQKSNRGLTLLTVHGLLFKTSREEEGVPWQWVAGWDGPENVVRKAIETLERLRRAEKCEPASSRYLFTRSHGRFVDGDANPLKSSYFTARVNKFARLYDIEPWHFTPRQFRRTFARWVTRKDPNALLALRRHFAHVSVQMTEFYSFWDSDLVQEVLDADIEQDYEALDEILAADHLAGQKGEEILSRNYRFRGVAGEEAREVYIRAELARPADEQLIIMRHDYGYCIYLD